MSDASDSAWENDDWKTRFKGGFRVDSILEWIAITLVLRSVLGSNVEKPLVPFGDRRDANHNTRDARAPRNHLSAAVGIAQGGILSRFLHEETTVLVRDGEIGLFHHLQHIFPDFAFLRNSLIAQQVGGVVSRHEWDAPEIHELAAHAGDAEFVPEQPFHRRDTQRDQDLWADDLDLPNQVGLAGVHFLRGRLAIAECLAGRVGAALEDIRDKDLVPAQTHRLDDLREQLPRLADERFALLIFIGPGRLTDEHYRRMNVADAIHHVLP